jgi:type I pantothenate kinase
MRPDATAHTAGQRWERLLFRSYARAAWSAAGGTGSAPLDPADLAGIVELNPDVGAREITEIFVPLGRLVDVALDTTTRRLAREAEVLGEPTRRRPFVLAVAGGVAAGKSTICRLIQTVLERMHPGLRTDVVSTDGFLYSNDELARRGLIDRKGFPESYRLHDLVAFLSALRNGEPEVGAPVYSHVAYDVVSGREHVVRSPDVVILEGLNILQTPRPDSSDLLVFVADFVDLAIYVHAAEESLRRWYVERFLRLRARATDDPSAYHHRYARLPDDEATAAALDVWTRINAPNLHLNIAPSRARADVVLVKGEDGSVERVLLR